jgi:flavin-dependent dehydrogenase
MSVRAADVVIVGGGPAGAAAAIRLARAGARAQVVDADDLRGDKVGESLAPSVRPLLERVGVWTQHCAASHRPCWATRSSWGGDGVDSHDFLRDPHGHGWHLDRRRFDATLAGEAVRAGCEWSGRTRVASLERRGDGWRVTLAGADGADLSARVLIDATGRPSHVARSQGARRTVHDHLVALVAFLVPQDAPLTDATTLVEAVAGGWWYSARLPDGRLACAFMTDPDLLRHAGAGRPSARAWDRELRRTVHTRARIDGSRYRLAAPPGVVAAGSAILDPPAAAGWIAAGDAAAAHDPLSGHGIGAAIAGGWDAGGTALTLLDGRAAAAEAYARRIKDGFARYLDTRRAYYRLERRWPGSAFWRRRH